MGCSLIVPPFPKALRFRCRKPHGRRTFFECLRKAQTLNLGPYTAGSYQYFMCSVPQGGKPLWKCLCRLNKEAGANSEFANARERAKLG